VEAEGEGVVCAEGGPSRLHMSAQAVVATHHLVVVGVLYRSRCGRRLPPQLLPKLTHPKVCVRACVPVCGCGRVFMVCGRAACVAAMRTTSEQLPNNAMWNEILTGTRGNARVSKYTLFQAARLRGGGVCVCVLFVCATTTTRWHGDASKHKQQRAR